MTVLDRQPQWDFFAVFDARGVRIPRFWAIGSGRLRAGAMYATWNTLDTAAAVAQLG